MIDWPTACAAVIPCLNEESRIGPVVRDVRSHLPTVVVVDDGSDDSTAEAAAHAGAQVLRHESPRGKGSALQSGWEWAYERGFQWSLALDGDGQHDAGDIPSFFAKAEGSGAPLVVGDRMADPRSMPWLRRRVNLWMSAKLSKSAGLRLRDTQCGYRLMDLSAWSGLRIESSHFEVESEVLLAFARAGHGIEFVPIRVIYRDEKSKIRPLRDTWRWFRWFHAVKGDPCSR